MAENESKRSDYYTNVCVTKYREDQWRALVEHKEGDKRERVGVKLNTTGRRKRDKEEAQAEAKALMRRMNIEHAQEHGGREAYTVSEYLNAYIEGRSINIERSTASEYRRLASMVGEELGSLPLSEVTPEDVEAWVTDLSKTWAPMTVRKALILLRSAYTQAVERDVVNKNPTRTVRGPKLEQRKPNALDERGRAKLAGFIALDPSTSLNVSYALALYLGMREAEICGLQWRYVDLDNKQIHIEKVIGHEKDRKGAQAHYLKAPKTRGSRRTLPIPSTLLGALKERRASCLEAALKMGLCIDDMFVTGKDDGTFMLTHYLSSKWKNTADVLELIGTEGVRPTFHDLRHTYATAAITNGVDVKTVSAILGHSNAAMTLNIYASADENAKRAGVEAVTEAISAERERHLGDGQVIRFKPTGTES